MDTMAENEVEMEAMMYSFSLEPRLGHRAMRTISTDCVNDVFSRHVCRK
jgi:hypothetical protein